MHMKKHSESHSPEHTTDRRERMPRPLRVLLDPDKPWLPLLTALLLTLLIESLARHDVWGGFAFLIHEPLAFWVNVGIIASTLLLSLFCPKRIPLLVSLSFVWFVMGMTEFILLFNRITPFTAVDLSVLFSVLTIMDHYLKVWQIVGIIVGLILCIAGLVFLFIRFRTRRFFWKRAVLSTVSAIGATALLIVIGFASGQISGEFTNLRNAYDEYGFSYCFLVSIVDRGVDKPDQYNEESVQEILADIPAAGEQSEQQPNVILVQLESIFDVSALEGVSFSEDPMPVLHRLMEQYPSGLLEVPVIGAGTVNSEFEVLTGMRVKDFGAAEYPFKSILTTATCETIAYDLLRSGYRTHAIHNHEGSFYGRNEVYAHLGFEDFTSIEYFRNPQDNGHDWALDGILTDEIMELIRSTSERDFVFAVSVQAHGSYPADYLPAEGDLQVTSGVADADSLSKLNYYLSQIREVDAFIGALYEAVMDLEEETVLVFYGDHLPSLAKDECFTLSTGDYQTPYLIISNYELDMTPATGEDLYAYQLFPLIMQLIGNDEGLINRFHTARQGTDGYLEDLEVLEYDLLYGEQYALEETYPIMTEMTMGTRPITITAVEEDEESIRVIGENFTPYSVIALNGSEKDTVYVDEHTLTCTKSLLDGWSLSSGVTVRQVAANGKILSETATYRVEQDGT